MTSMPASRRARAMIFAPRSWPSRPGFAMTTRIFAATALTLEDRRLAPDTPHVSQRVAHLAHRQVRARSGQDRLHQVRVSCRAALELGERLLGSGGVAARPHRTNALDLLLLERGIDAQDLERRLVVELVTVDADDHALPGLDLGLVAVRRLCDLSLHEVVLDRGHDA